MTRDYLTSPIAALPDDHRALGIHQSDIIIRTAIIAGLADMRENPKLLDYVFASLPRDSLSYSVYGEEQVAAAKKWFLDTEIHVFMNTRIDESKMPCITIGLSTSAEAGATLGDMHYETVEVDKDETPIVYGGPFNPQKYEADTGIVTMPSSFSAEIFPGQFVRDRQNNLYEIQEVLDALTFIIDPNLNISLTNFYIVSGPQKRTATMESIEFREVYELGVHVVGEPTHLIYLYSVLLFILLRYKEALLEARGLTRTTLSAGPVTLNTSFQVSQPVFTRMITLTGFVHHYWPKFFSGPIIGITPDIREINETWDGVRQINEDETTGPIYEET